MKKCFYIAATGAFLLSATLVGQDLKGWIYSKETADKLTKGRSEFNYYEEKVAPYKLPGLLQTSSGKEIKTAAGWKNERRPELMKLFTTNMFGKMPGTKYVLSFKLTEENPVALDGKATLKKVDILIESGGKSLVIHLYVFLPNLEKKVPVFLLIDNRSQDNIDPSRKIKSEFWPVEEAIERGYGMAAFFNGDVDPDDYDGFKNGIHGLLDVNGRQDDSWGTLAAWAWGAQRCLDYLLTDKRVDGRKVAVIGHSRGGKTALWAGATDQRFGMVIANESGCGGSALARRKYGETVARINTAFPHWFCTNFRQYGGNEDNMPFDMHMLLSLIAPRPLYIDAAADDLWGDPKGSYLSLFNAQPVYSLFHYPAQLPSDVPELDKQVISGNIGFHIRAGEHNLKLKDWNFIMDFADNVWGKKQAYK
ncbi:MAG: acetylxylan esterase [Bacteroidales bacterium]